MMSLTAISLQRKQWRHHPPEQLHHVRDSAAVINGALGGQLRFGDTLFWEPCGKLAEAAATAEPHYRAPVEATREP